MKEIQLSNCDRVALVDDEDFPLLNRHTWRRMASGKTQEYAATEVRGKVIFMHNLIFPVGSARVADHKDRNGLNNQKDNLRECGHGQNSANACKINGCSSQYKGVNRNKGRWQAGIWTGERRRHLGTFDDEQAAARAYDAAAKEQWGEFALLNFP